MEMFMQFIVASLEHKIRSERINDNQHNLSHFAPQPLANILKLQAQQ